MKPLFVSCGITAALLLGVASTGPVAAQDVQQESSGTEWSTPVRLGNSGLDDLKADESFGIAMNSRGDAVALGFDVTPRVGPDGKAPVRGYGEAANVVYRYVGGTWRDPETISAPEFIQTYLDPVASYIGLTRSTLALSDAGHAVIVLGGRGYVCSPSGCDVGYVEDYGLFMSTSHDLTQPDSFTPWRRITPPRGTVPPLHTPSVVVTDSGDVIVAYSAMFAGSEGGCAGATYATVGRISSSGFVAGVPRTIAPCLPMNPMEYQTTSQIDVSLSGTTASIASVVGDPGCNPFATCTWVELTTYSTSAGTWSDPVQVLPTLQSHEVPDPGWYHAPHVATSAAGTAIIARKSSYSGTTRSVSFTYGRAGEPPAVEDARLLGNAGEWYDAADLVMAEDGRALAAFQVGCDGCASDYTRRFETLEFDRSSQTTKVLGSPATSLQRPTLRPWITLAMPRGAASLASARVAYTEADLLAHDGGRAAPDKGRIFVAQWPFTGQPQEIPGFPGSTTAEYKAPLAPALAVSSSGSALIAFRPDRERVRVGRWFVYPGNELWVSALGTPNSTGLFPPAYLRAYVDEAFDAPLNRMAVSVVRPYFYPDGSGAGGYYDGWVGVEGLSSRASYEVFIHSAPPGFTIPTGPICTNGFAADETVDSGRALRGTSRCVIRDRLPSGTYTFTARTLLDGKVSAMSPPTAPLNFIAPPDPPGAPTDVVGVASDGQVTVRWKAPASDGGSPIRGYRVFTSPSQGGCETEGELTCTVTGLTNGTAYTFTMTAWNVAGNSPVSTPSAPVTPRATPTTQATITIQKVKRGKGKAAATVTVKGRTKGLAVREIITLQLLTRRNTWTNSAQYLIQKGGRFTAKWRRPAAHTFRFVHEATATVSAQRTVKAS